MTNAIKAIVKIQNEYIWLEDYAVGFLKIHYIYVSLCSCFKTHTKSSIHKKVI